MKSKTARTSKSTAKTKTTKAKPKAAQPSESLTRGETAAFAESLEVGHKPPSILKPQDEKLFKAFQTNLLSLISHELRTPLTGILNALGLLEDPEAASFDSKELVKMARQNAQRLHRTLVTLLDLAAIESGSFQIRLREVELGRLTAGRIDGQKRFIEESGLGVEFAKHDVSPVLADPLRFGRAVDLALQAVIPRARAGSKLSVRTDAGSVSIAFELATGKEKLWQAAWEQGLSGAQSGVASPSSAFAGVMQSEEAFLTRVEEGLGSEHLLIHEILRAHRGAFEQKLAGSRVELLLKIPALSSEAAVRAVLSSRAYHVSSELGSVALVLIEVPDSMTVTSLAREIKASLFRASDTAYMLEDRLQVALVLDDCRAEDGPRMMARIQQSLGLDLEYGIAHCPADGLDPAALLDLAQKRLVSGSK